MTKRGFEVKTSLNAREKLKAAYFHEVRGIDQHVLADMFEVNVGRINEAIMDVRKAINGDGNESIRTGDRPANKS
jgi:hypothetical protein